MDGPSEILGTKVLPKANMGVTTPTTSGPRPTYNAPKLTPTKRNQQTFN